MYDLPPISVTAGALGTAAMVTTAFFTHPPENDSVPHGACKQFV